MTRPQRRLHLLLWVVLAAAITLTVRHAVDTRAATWGALESDAPADPRPSESPAP